MKHQRIERRHTDIEIPGLSDEEIERRVFINLEARQMRRKDARESSVVILNHPDDRRIFQRLSDWWKVRSRMRPCSPANAKEQSTAEPVWPRHWATVRYL